MFKIVQYKHEHVVPLLDQKINSGIKDYFLEGPGKDFETRGTAVTGMLNGEVMVCGAIEKIWDHRGIIWCVFNEKSKHNHISIFRAMKKFLKESAYDRIEVSVACDFAHGRRRVEMLGFKLECERAAKYLPDGTDCAIYSMVRA